MAPLGVDHARQRARRARSRSAPRHRGAALSPRTSPPPAPVHLALAAKVQSGIHRFYRLEETPEVASFLKIARGNERETVRIRHARDGALEIEVRTPPISTAQRLDELCQLIEGVSHFVYVADRARRELPVTQLELELQAEIDKYMLLVLSKESFDTRLARLLHLQLYDRVQFSHPEGTVLGDRYRLANDLAARFVRRMEVRYAKKGRRDEMRAAMARFYGMGQAEKIGFACAA